MIRPSRFTLAAVEAAAWLANTALEVAVPSKPTPTVTEAALRAENRNLTREVHLLAKLLDNLRVDLTRAEAMLQHPSNQTAVGASRDDLMDLCDVLTIGDALLELDAVETVGDILWLTGGDS